MQPLTDSNLHAQRAVELPNGFAELSSPQSMFVLCSKVFDLDASEVFDSGQITRYEPYDAIVFNYQQSLL